jgi:hypothetical protein
LRKQLQTNQPKDQHQHQNPKSPIQGKDHLSFPLFILGFQLNIGANSISHATR